ncbi:hypothetical protein HU200_021647 [Digitaria exilis]|uniref:3-ketoacyl-CoA synthase n=1 Tax=Digitaria exilis TaxID=1010633 RepID=A0A835EZF5_9POAL|nr:hypothetical protein HU200_021647 [Digitaria exilis]
MLLKVTRIFHYGLLTWSTTVTPPIHHLLTFLLLTVIAAKYLIKRPRAVYLVDYACFGPSSNLRSNPATWQETLRSVVDDDTMSFITKISRRSGLGNETCLPSSIHYIPPIHSLHLAPKTRVEPNKIDILIVNCSVTTTIPSMADMIINRYKLRSDVRNMQLSGMGCSAGLIAVGLARNLLQTIPYGSCALVVSTEILTGNFYLGKKRGMQLTNMLFRMGGAAVLLSTSSANARFELMHLVRKSTSAQDSAYHCVYQEEDDEGNMGANLSKDLVATAGEALRANITTIAPLVLPVSELLSFFLSSIAQKVFIIKKNASTKPYVPNFSLAVEHFCVHAGGRAVIDAVQRSLNLSDEQVEPSRMTLHRFGNTSSSSLWYEMAYCEAKQLMRKRDRVWMISFGSGYKCNSAVWKCILPALSPDSAWANCIHRYPVDVPK